MRCVLVHPFMDTRGGAEQLCLEALAALTEQGVDTELLSNILDRQPEEASLLGYPRTSRIIPYPAFKPRSNRFKLYQRLIHHKLNLSMMKRKVEQADIEFLTQDVLYYCGLAKRTIAYVHYPEYLLHLDVPGEAAHSLWNIYYFPVRRIYRRNIDYVDTILCNSDFTRRVIEEKWHRRAHVVYPPVNVAQFRPYPKEPFVVTVGRFSREKNFELVIKVARDIPDTTFFIVGRKEDERYYERIRLLKPKNVTLICDLPFNQLVSLLARAKVYLHTMINEHFGISIVEAMASGCIPVVHDSGGSKEILCGLGYVYKETEDCLGRTRDALGAETAPLTFSERAAKFDTGLFRKRLWAVLKQDGFF